MKLARAPLERLVGGLEAIFGGDLVGAYIHGSVALGCYGPHGEVDARAQALGH